MIYLDHHATTPCDPSVVEAMIPYFTEKFGNPSSITHRLGIEAKAGIEFARRQIAEHLGATPEEILFTSGATEALNLAILGIARSSLYKRLIASPLEHPAVLEPLRYLEKNGYSLEFLDIDGDGCVLPESLEKALQKPATLVAIQLANGEIGTLQDLPTLGEICRKSATPLICDAAQALSTKPLDVQKLNVDALALSAHKAYGPKGVGALFLRRGRPIVTLEPLCYGGGQERGLRPGTLAVPLIVGFGKAVSLIKERWPPMEEIERLRDFFWDTLSSHLPEAIRNTPFSKVLPQNLHMSIPNIPSEVLLRQLPNLAISAGSACSSGEGKPSPVVTTVFGIDRAKTGLRFGLGRTTTREELQQAVVELTNGIQRIKK